MQNAHFTSVLCNRPEHHHNFYTNHLLHLSARSGHHQMLRLPSKIASLLTKSCACHIKYHMFQRGKGSGTAGKNKHPKRQWFGTRLLSETYVCPTGTRFEAFSDTNTHGRPIPDCTSHTPPNGANTIVRPIPAPPPNNENANVWKPFQANW